MKLPLSILKEREQLLYYDNLETLFKNHPEPVYCARLGCGKILTLEEKRYGNHCFNHSTPVKIDVTKHLNL